MIISVHQPAYLPWLGYFHKIMLSDQFIFLDTVQFEKNSFNNRNKIKTPKEALWLSVPVLTKNYKEKKFHEIEIAQEDWNKKHFKTIVLNYKNSTYFDHYIDQMEQILIKNHYQFLADLNFDLLVFFLDVLNIKTTILKSSQHDFKGTKSELILNICKELGATGHIFGALGKNYVDENIFKSHGLKVFYQNYQHPVYKQLYGDFIPNLSIIDLLFNEGPRSKEIIMCNNQSKGSLI